MGFLKKLFSFINNILSKTIGLILILISIFLRFYKLNDFVTFLGDQGRDAIIIKRIVTLEHFPAIGAPTSIGQIFLGPFYYYLISPFLLLFKFDPYGLAFGVAILSIAGLICSYLISKKYLSQIGAFVFLFLSTFSLALINSARFSWNPNLLPFSAFFCIYFMNKLVERDKIIDYIAFGALLSISIQFHYLGIFLFLPLIYVLFQKFFIKKDKINYLNLIAGISSCLIFSSPLIIFDLKHQFINSKNFLNLIFLKKTVISQESLLARFLDTNKQFYFHALKLDLSPLLALIITSCLFIFIYKTAKRSFVKINLVNFLSFLIFFSFLNSSRHLHYYGQIYLSFFLIIASLTSNAKLIKRFIILISLALYLFLNLKNYNYFWETGSFQIKRARKIASTFSGKINTNSFLVITEPFTESADPVKYFLEINGKKALPEDYPGQADQLFLMCYLEECAISGNPQWQLSSFKNPVIDKIWKVEGIKIYKVIHGQ